MREGEGEGERGMGREREREVDRGIDRNFLFVSVLIWVSALCVSVYECVASLSLSVCKYVFLS